MADAECRFQEYVDITPPEHPVTIGKPNHSLFSEMDGVFRCNRQRDINVAIAVGNTPAPVTKDRAQITEESLYSFSEHHSPRRGERSVLDVKLGQGCIISMDARVSTNVRMGDFVFLNIGAMVCHDGRLGDYVTLAPDVKLAGAVCSDKGGRRSCFKY